MDSRDASSAAPPRPSMTGDGAHSLRLVATRCNNTVKIVLRLEDVWSSSSSICPHFSDIAWSLSLCYLLLNRCSLVTTATVSYNHLVFRTFVLSNWVFFMDMSPACFQSSLVGLCIFKRLHLCGNDHLNLLQSVRNRFLSGASSSASSHPRVLQLYGPKASGHRPGPISIYCRWTSLQQCLFSFLAKVHVWINIV